ncbi:hypothetical protein AAE478_007780 [Parahypoxylon ruwenzoriense]
MGGFYMQYLEIAIRNTPGDLVVSNNPTKMCGDGGAGQQEFVSHVRNPLRRHDVQAAWVASTPSTARNLEPHASILSNATLPRTYGMELHVRSGVFVIQLSCMYYARSPSRHQGGFTCLVLVNGREYQTDLAYESDHLAQENAAMRAFMVCRNFSVNGGMLARNGIVQGLPANESTRRKKSRHTSSHGHNQKESRHRSGHHSSSSSTASFE